MEINDDDVLSEVERVAKEYGDIRIERFKGDDTISYSTVKRRFGSVPLAASEAGVGEYLDGYDKCHDCGGWYESMGRHVAGSSCSYDKETILNHIQKVAEEQGNINVEHFGGELYTRKAIESVFGSVNKAASVAEVEDCIEGYRKCRDCGGLYRSIGKHYNNSSCSAPELSDSEKEIFKGILLGDGNISGKNTPYFSFGMSDSDEFVKWVDSEIEYHTTIDGYEFEKDEHSDGMKLRTVSHPWFETLRSWYVDGDKMFPEDIYLTPEILRMWYVCDGYLDSGPAITMWNFENQRHIVMEKFREIGLDPTWRESNKAVALNGEYRYKFFDYVGDPPPSFEYKWMDV